jgi:hypothetical protein
VKAKFNLFTVTRETAEALFPLARTDEFHLTEFQLQHRLQFPPITFIQAKLLAAKALPLVY